MGFCYTIKIALYSCTYAFKLTNKNFPGNVETFMAIKSQLILVKNCFNGTLKGVTLMVSIIKVIGNAVQVDVQIFMAIKMLVYSSRKLFSWQIKGA